MARAKPWRELRRQHVVSCRIFDVERSVAESPVDGTEHEYYRILSPDWVQIIPITPADEVVMVRQYRHGSSAIELEIPGGLIDAGEDPAAAAIRECREETGYEAPEARSLGSINPNPALHSHRLYSYYARNVRPVGEILNTATEQTEVELVPLADIPARIRAGDIDHALVVHTLWRFLHEQR